MRRLPVYLLIDCSQSMRGKPMEMVNCGIDCLVRDMRMNPYALETVCMSVISFSTGAEEVCPLVELSEFSKMKLDAKGRSDMGAALSILDRKLDTEVITNTPERKGDWQPVVFILSDGRPGDAWITPAKKIREKSDLGKANVIAVLFGEKALAEKMFRITRNVIISQSTEPESFAKFLSWVSVKISNSCKVGNVDENMAADTGLPTGFERCIAI